jgi:predicted phosphoserine aminotransferase
MRAQVPGKLHANLSFRPQSYSETWVCQYQYQFSLYLLQYPLVCVADTAQGTSAQVERSPNKSRSDRIVPLFAQEGIVAMAHLFIPGPTDVAPAILQAQDHPMIGHRSQAFSDLFERIQTDIRPVLQTQHRVYITASSGSGLQEAAVRNCVTGRLLLCASGAFGERWHEVALSNGVPTDLLATEWGLPLTPDQVEDALAKGEYDTLAVVHNETSTGVENPVGPIIERVRSLYPDIVVLVDAVSSAGGVDIPVDDWGIDVLLTSSQKCFALPPGLAFAAVSDRALERARQVEHRGWYFDFLLLEKYLVEKKSTPATPAISLLFALDAQLDRMLAEGMRARHERHQTMARRVQAWAEERFGLFAAEGFRSKTVTTVRKPTDFDFAGLTRFLADQGMVIANGYGKIKGETFRIGHMGEIMPGDVDRLLGAIDAFLAGS